MNESPERQEDPDPAPIKDSDAERVTGEQAEGVGSARSAEDEIEDPDDAS